MTAYFDRLTATVRLEEDRPDADFLRILENIESELINDVFALAADREFPADLRKLVLDTVKQFAVNRSTEAKDYAVVMRSSRLISELHGVFHRIGERHVMTRHGLIMDSPEGFRERAELELELLDDEEWRQPL